jgi:hypothetical protein
MIEHVEFKNDETNTWKRNELREILKGNCCPQVGEIWQISVNCLRKSFSFSVRFDSEPVLSQS